MKTLLLIVDAILMASVSCYSETPVQYHIQTDSGPERFFRYQTYNGQFRKEKRLEDGTVVGTYGWVDPTNKLRLFDYIADKRGYRIVRKRILDAPPSLNQIPTEAVKPKPGAPFHKKKTVVKKRPVTVQSLAKPVTFKPPENDRVSSSPDYSASSKQVFSGLDFSVSSQPVLRPLLLRPKRPLTQEGASVNSLAARPFSAADSKTPALRPLLARPLKPLSSSGQRTGHPGKGDIRPGRYQFPRNAEKESNAVRRRPPHSRPQAHISASQVTRKRRLNQERPTDTPPEPSRSTTSSARQEEEDMSAFLMEDVPGGKYTLRYDLGNQFHEERVLPDGTKVGKHGYVDPFGILRVTFYRSLPGRSLEQRTRSHWVGSRQPGT